MKDEHANQQDVAEATRIESVNPQFAMCYRAVMSHPDLSHAGRLTYVALSMGTTRSAEHPDAGTCRRAHSTLGSYVGLTDRAIRKGIGELVEIGVLTKRRVAYNSNVYVMHDLEFAFTTAKQAQQERHEQEQREAVDNAVENVPDEEPRSAYEEPRSAYEEPRSAFQSSSLSSRKRNSSSSSPEIVDKLKWILTHDGLPDWFALNLPPMLTRYESGEPITKKQVVKINECAAYITAREKAREADKAEKKKNEGPSQDELIREMEERIRYMREPA